MNPKKIHYKALADTIIENFKKRQIDGYYCATAGEAVSLANSFLRKGAAAGFGGSMTLEETGMLDSLRANPDITLYDRSKAGSQEEIAAIYRKCFSADYYFMSANAITLDGELVNIDGTGNRVAALIYGPNEVIVLAGMNKVAGSIDEAVSRIHNAAAPPNGVRLNRKTPCAVTGKCTDCLSPDCMCSQTVITRRSGIAGRIKVILIGETLGY